MTDANISDYILAIFTPTTLIVTAALGFALAYFLWTSERHVPNVMFFYIWITGTSFALALSLARWIDGGPMWTVWLGSAGLWTWFIIWATVVVAIKRRTCHKK